jgi:hypothetical protein
VFCFVVKRTNSVASYEGEMKRKTPGKGRYPLYYHLRNVRTVLEYFVRCNSVHTTVHVTGDPSERALDCATYSNRVFLQLQAISMHLGIRRFQGADAQPYSWPCFPVERSQPFQRPEALGVLQLGQWTIRMSCEPAAERLRPAMHGAG